MSQPARFTQADIQRALKAARTSGYHEVRMVVVGKLPRNSTGKVLKQDLRAIVRAANKEQAA